MGIDGKGQWGKMRGVVVLVPNSHWARFIMALIQNQWCNDFVHLLLDVRKKVSLSRKLST